MKAITVYIGLVFLNSIDSSQSLSFTARQLYILRGNLQIQSAQVNETYEVWYNGETNKSRVDFYNGMDKLFRAYDPNLGKYFYHKIYPEKTSGSSNSVSCNMMTGTSILQVIDNNSYLPIKDYSFVKMEKIGGIQTQKWVYKKMIYAKNKVQEIYTMWVKEIWSNHVKKIIPVRYIFEIKDKYKVIDSYRHDYTYFEDIKFDDFILEVPVGMKCKAVELSAHELIDPLMEFVNPSIERTRVTEAFDNFKIQHSKMYSTEEEHQKRLTVFMNNMRFINSFNRQHKSFSLAINHLADRTDDELSTFMRLKVADNFIEGNMIDVFHNNDDDEVKGSYDNIDRELDWRNFGAITEVKDQTWLCGSCYAFATAATVESAAFIHRGCKNLEEASEQSIIDCSWGQNNNGCIGGWLTYSLKMIKQNGLPLRKEYGPYLDMEGVCHIANMTKLIKIDSYQHLTKNKKSIKKAIQKKGPLLAAINARPKSFTFYSSGVYDDPECDNEPYGATHAVTVIGYGMTSDLQYWIVKNSYGARWGEDGYMRIAINNNICGIKNYLYSVDFKGTSMAGMCFIKS